VNIFFPLKIPKGYSPSVFMMRPHIPSPMFKMQYADFPIVKKCIKCT
jgi:hypothetical protein